MQRNRAYVGRHDPKDNNYGNGKKSSFEEKTTENIGESRTPGSSSRLRKKTNKSYGYGVFLAMAGRFWNSVPAVLKKPALNEL